MYTITNFLFSVDKVALIFQMAAKCATLKVIIVMEDPISILQKWGAQLGIHVISFPQVLALGR